MFAGNRPFDAEADPLSRGVADGDATEAAGAAAGVAFRPNCLGMQTSIVAPPVRRRVSSPSKP